jgi:cobalt-zinc-cadmium efflux system protein
VNVAHDHDRDRPHTAAEPSHHHGVTADADRRYLTLALGLILAFIVGEVAAAAVSGSLALFADAGHMLIDAVALGGALVAIALARRPAQGSWTFGLERAEILSAAGNGVTLLVVAALIGFEAVRRLIEPPQVEGLVVLVVALVGVVVNLAATASLARANRSSLNVEGAFQHILTDLYAFAATAVAGAVIVTTGFRRADPIASLVVVALMLRAAAGLLRASGRVLLEAAPEHVDLTEVRSHLLDAPHVVAVHDLHVVTITSGLPVLTAHVVVSDECFATGAAGRVLDELQGCLAGHFDVEHSTFQLEPSGHDDHEAGTHL